MDSNLVINFYNRIRVKWPSDTVEWHELDPQRQLMFIQALNMIIGAMQR